MTSAPAASSLPLLLVLVGTDHHPFDRLVGWVDRWAAAHRDEVRVVVQHGTAAPPAVARGQSMLSHNELVTLVDEASVVVTHGGPATIADVRRSGRRPVVVPRDPRLGEHVDGHQQRFVRRLAADGFVELCETEEQFVETLDRCLAAPELLLLDADDDRARVARAVAAVGEVLTSVTTDRRSGRRTPGPTR